MYCTLVRGTLASELAWTGVHSKLPLGRTNADMSRGWCRNAGAAKAFERRRKRRMPEYLLGRKAIDDAGVDRILGVVNGGRGVVHGLIDEAPQV